MSEAFYGGFAVPGSKWLGHGTRGSRGGSKGQVRVVGLRDVLGNFRPRFWVVLG